jgi:hypothetical protein
MVVCVFFFVIQAFRRADPLSRVARDLRVRLIDSGQDRIFYIRNKKTKGLRIF